MKRKDSASQTIGRIMNAFKWNCEQFCHCGDLKSAFATYFEKVLWHRLSADSFSVPGELLTNSMRHFQWVNSRRYKEEKLEGLSSKLIKWRGQWLTERGKSHTQNFTLWWSGFCFLWLVLELIHIEKKELETPENVKKTSNGKLMRAADSFSALNFLMRFVCSTVMNEKCLLRVCVQGRVLKRYSGLLLRL